MTDRPPMFNLEVAESGMAVKDMAPAWYAFMGIAQQRETGGSGGGAAELVEYANAPADEAWVYSCVRRLANSAQSVPLRVYVKEGNDRIAAELTNDAAARDLAWLLSHVNGMAMNWSDLIAFTMTGLGVWGEAHWRKVRGRLGGAPQELWWLPSTAMKPDPDPVWPKSWTYAPTRATREQIPVRDLVTFKTVNLTDPTRGLSPLASIRNEISVNRQAGLQTRATLQNWGIPAGAWVVPKGEIITPQDQNLIRRALRALRGPAASGKTPVLPNGIEWRPLALNPKDAEWIAARKISRMAICAALGVPLLLAGDDEHTTTVYAGLRDVEKAFWKSTMIPWLDWIANTIEGWLVTDFDPRRERIEVAFDYSGIEALQDSLTDQITSANGLMDREALTINEVRAKFRLGPPVPWGDEPRSRVTSPAPTPDPELTVDPAPTTVDDTTAAADRVRSLGKQLYRNAAVRAFLAGGDLDTTVLVGHELPMAARHQLEMGLTRRYSADQIADGVPAEGYAGLQGVTA